MNFATLSCDPCKDVANNMPTIVLLVLLGLGIVAVGIFLCRRYATRDRVETITRGVSEVFRSDRLKSVFEQKHMLEGLLAKSENKRHILIYTLQVIYQYSTVVTGNNISIEYPEPARATQNFLAVFSLQPLNFVPPGEQQQRAGSRSVEPDRPVRRMC